MNIKQKFVFDQALLYIFKKRIHPGWSNKLEPKRQKDIWLVFGVFCGTVKNIFSDTLKALVFFHELTQINPLNLSVYIRICFLSTLDKN